MNYKMSNNVPIIDRIMSAVSYLTAGWGGLIYCIILYFMKRHISNFVRFNVVQSIFFAIAYFILSVLLNFTFSLLSHIPIIQIIVAWIELIFFSPLLFGLSFLQLFVNALLLYFVVMSLLGRYPVIYKLSEILMKR